MTVGNIVAQLRLDSTNFQQGLARANSLLEQHGALAMRAGMMLAGFGAAIAGALAVGVKLASEFEAEMRNVNSILKETEPNLEAMSQAILDMAGEVAQTPAVLARGLYDIASSGFAGADALKVLEASAIAATAGLTDTATASKAVTAVLNAYGMGADQVTRVTDVLFKTVERGVITFAELSQNLGQVISTAAIAGVSIEEVGAAIATMTRAGMQAPEAVTALNQGMLNFIRPTDGAKEAAEAMGIELTATNLAAKGLSGVMAELGAKLETSVEELIALERQGAKDADVLDIVARRMGLTSEKLAELFPNIRALRMALVLAAGGGKEFAEDVEAMANATGATAAALAEQSKSLRVQWAKTMATLKAGAIEFGAVLLPILKELTGGMRALGQILRSLPPWLKTLVVLAAAAAAGFAMLTAAFIMYQTQMKSAIPVTLAMVGAMKQMIVTLATTNVTLTATALNLGRVGAAATKAGAAIKGLTLASVAGVGILAALVAGTWAFTVGMSRLKEETETWGKEYLELLDKVHKAGVVMPVGLFEDVRPPSGLIQAVSAVREALGMEPHEAIKQFETQKDMIRHLVDLWVEHGRSRVEADAKAQATLKEHHQTALQNRLDEIDQEREANLKEGMDEQLANEVAENLRVVARQDSNTDIMKLEAQLLEAEGKTHEARVQAIIVEGMEWRKQNEKLLGAEKAAEGARRLTRAKFRDLDREEAEESAQAFEKKAGEIVAAWLGAVEAMRQADRLQTDEYLGELSKVLGFIEEINEARRAAGEAPLFRDEELRLAQTIASERRRMQQEMEAAEKSASDKRKAWTQEELDERKRLHDYELSLMDLTFQHKRDLLRITGQDDEQTMARIAAEELAALQQRRAEEDLTAQERLDSLQRERQLILEMAQAGEMPAPAATAALQSTFEAMQEAKEELAAQDRAAFEERRKQHAETVAQIETEQKTLRDQLRETAGSIADSATRVFDGIEARLQRLSQVRLEPAAAGAGGVGGGRTVIFNIDGRRADVEPNIQAILDAAAQALELQHVHGRG